MSNFISTAPMKKTYILLSTLFPTGMVLKLLTMSSQIQTSKNGRTGIKYLPLSPSYNKASSRKICVKTSHAALTEPRTQEIKPMTILALNLIM